MSIVHVLDCTLRDGGYCNNWQFGFENTKKIISGLVKAGVDVVECGFLIEKIDYQKDATRYSSLEQISKIIPEKRDGKLFVVMMNYGDYDVDKLPKYDGSSIDGIRLAFHKKNYKEAIELAARIKDKGYKVFIQAMVSVSYSDAEFLDLIKRTNEIEPYAFYIVDSFGMMKSKELIRLYEVVEKNVKENIWIGFHSHNNMQLAYSNAQTLVSVCKNRNLVVDSSVYGMGRGAGNLNTELFIEYLNENSGTNYQLKPLLNIIDEILNEFYQINRWGYSLPNYISAVNNAHPNYARYLDEKKTLTVEDMNEIFLMMNEDKKVVFDKEYIESLYLKYMANGKANDVHKEELQKVLQGKTVILIAPGRSSLDQKELIIDTAKQSNTIVVSINNDYTFLDTNYIFLSNLRRFKQLDSKNKDKCIATSNIPAEDAYLLTDYKELLNKEENVQDNAGLMAVKFLINYGVSEIKLAGFDGYSHEVEENYANKQSEFITPNAVLDSMNVGMSKVLEEYSKSIKISFLTTQKFVKW